jgi:hypothetical protein
MFNMRSLPRGGEEARIYRPKPMAPGARSAAQRALIASGVAERKRGEMPDGNVGIGCRALSFGQKMTSARLAGAGGVAFSGSTAATPIGVVPSGSLFDAMLERAMRLCGAAFGELQTFDGERFGMAALRGLPPLKEAKALLPSGLARMTAHWPTRRSADTARNVS